MEPLRTVKIELYTQWLSTLGLLMSVWLPSFVFDVISTIFWKNTEA